jgi:hypothetical protein
MSLAAAVAVAGLTSTVSAKNLEDAIKGVEVSGYIDYRKEYKSQDVGTGVATATDNDINEYAVNVTAKTKVNDTVSATVSMGFDEVQTSNASATSKDGDPSLNVSNAYFTFDMGMATVMAGKQNIPSVFVDQVDTAKTGAGVVALVKASDALTVAAAHFTNTNIVAADTKTTELVAMGAVGPASYAVNYNMTDINGQESTRYSVNAGFKAAGVKLDLRHSSAEVDAAAGLTSDATTLTKVVASAKMGPVGVVAGYAMTNDTTGQTAARTSLAIDGDNDAKVDFKVWQLSLAKYDDAQAYLVGVDATLAGVNVGVKYAAATIDGNGAADTDASETLVSATYKMSPNFTLHARYSVLEMDGKTDTDYSRLQAKFTF